MIDCKEAVRRMWAYIGRGLEDHASDEFEEHLGTCRRCCGELEFSRQLQATVASAKGEGMPPETRRKIDELLKGSDPWSGQAKP